MGKVLPLEHSRRPVRLTWLVYSKIPTCAPSTPSVSLLCQRTYNLQEESEERELRLHLLFLQILHIDHPHLLVKYTCTLNTKPQKHFAILRTTFQTDTSKKNLFFFPELEFHKHERKSMQKTSLFVENVFKY